MTGQMPDQRLVSVKKAEDELNSLLQILPNNDIEHEVTEAALINTRVARSMVELKMARDAQQGRTHGT